MVTTADISFWQLKSLSADVLAGILERNKHAVDGFGSEHMFWLRRLIAPATEEDKIILGTVYVDDSEYQWKVFGLPFSTHTAAMTQLGLPRVGEIRIILPRLGGRSDVRLKIGSQKAWHFVFGRKTHHLSEVYQRILENLMIRGIYKKCREDYEGYCAAASPQPQAASDASLEKIDEMTRRISELETENTSLKAKIEELKRKTTKPVSTVAITRSLPTASPDLTTALVERAERLRKTMTDASSNLDRKIAEL